jgi:uncharacterized protein (DUF1499 family)
VVGASAGALMLMPRRWATINDVTTGRTSEYAEIQPQRFELSTDALLAAIEETIQGMQRWKIVGKESADRRIEAEVRTALFGFTDDVSIWLEPDGEAWRVMVRSRSRVGRGDLGENARTIRAFQQALERHVERLPASRTRPRTPGGSV